MAPRGAPEAGGQVTRAGQRYLCARSHGKRRPMLASDLDPYLRCFEPSIECFTTLSGTDCPCRTVKTALRLNPRSISTTR